MRWELYKKRIAVGGATRRDKNINSLKSDIDKYGIDLPSCKSVKINGESKKLFINSTTDPYKKTYNDVYGVIPIAGTLVEWEGFWLVESRDLDDEVYSKGKISYCNYNLKFINNSGQVISRYCIIENKSNDDGIKTTGQITVGDGRLYIKLPFDSQTKYINRTYSDGQDRRLLVDFDTDEPSAYKVTHVDRVSIPGCIRLTLQEVARSENDNIEQMVADYNRVTNAEPTPSDEGLCLIQYSGKPMLSVGMGFKTFNAVFKDKDGNVLDGITPVWSLAVSDPTLSTSVVTEQSGDYIKIKATDSNLIGGSVRLNLTNPTATVSNYVVLEVVVIG